MDSLKISLVCTSLIVLLCLLCYQHSLNGDFVFDDTVAIVKNKDVTRQPMNLSQMFQNDFWGLSLQDRESHKSYRPLTTLMFHVEYTTLGWRAKEMKAINLLLHCINTILLWNLVRHLELEHGLQIATIAAALFAIHPVHVEPVAGVVGRAELMFCLLYLLSLLIISRSDVDSVGATILIILLTGLGILFKETAITIPMACVFVDYMRRYTYELKWRQQVEALHTLRNILFGLAMSCFLLLRLWMQDFKSPHFKPMDNPVAFDSNILTRIFSQQYLYVLNFWIMLNPQWLCYDWALGCIKLITSAWDLRIQAILALYTFILLTLKCNENFVNALSVGLIIIPFLPASGIIKVGFVIAERILYVPSIGFCLLVAYSFMRLLKMTKLNWLRTLIKLMLMFLFVTFIVRTRIRATEWRTEQTLFQSALKVCPKNAKVHYNIARLAVDREERELALKFYRNAVTLYPTYEAALMNLGNLYRETGDLLAAENYIKKALMVVPEFSTAWMNLGIVQSARKHYSEALESYQMALKYRKNYAVCYYNLGNLYLELKQYTLAIQSWQRSVNINPRQPKAWTNLLNLLDSHGLFEDGLRWSEQAMTHLPDETNILFIRANIFGKMKHYVEAEGLYKRILTLEPKNVLYQTNLAILYHRWGFLEKAIEGYRKAIKIDYTKATTAAQHLEKLLDRLEKEGKIVNIPKRKDPGIEIDEEEEISAYAYDFSSKIYNEALKKHNKLNL